jgi:dihydroorotase/N-acyl-D-amino-acid deacylase
MLGQSEFNVLVDPRAASKITQGVTTEITGEGSSIAPLNEALVKSAQPTYDRFKVVLDFRTLSEYFSRLEKNRPAINIGTFVGAGGLRAYVVGNDQKTANAQELDAMKKLVEQAMQQGALGEHAAAIRAGTLWPRPTRSSARESRDQIRRHLHSHQRSESGQIMASLDEVRGRREGEHLSEVWHSRPLTRPTGDACPRC